MTHLDAVNAFLQTHQGCCVRRGMVDELARALVTEGPCAEATAVRDERDRLLRWKAEATSLFDGLQDLGRALEVPLGVLVTGPIALEAATRLRAERDAAIAGRQP